ncbi:hypothetical protein BCR33DRAFT_717745 [Rhizoclosmatium globosum]|uniref:Uncharacterized protein n=1 Tax=Rhizoclosmatium globosum TaxID=329046 RepID=A0A1Y2C7M0_9FUNG|nr:hypothetical protein BCR33DRAFT_717739 [Rhizoclosmatium globosum]ORY43019.1 hypothetical protein BCR33DRAFT_717745 [Rhizoclosmatium globosum]|eukprot:ORY43014.1 hypothetical protein BCR33DRAFT_717739 [Rhizoclosmatium globosum]
MATSLDYSLDSPSLAPPSIWFHDSLGKLFLCEYVCPNIVMTLRNQKCTNSLPL